MLLSITAVERDAWASSESEQSRLLTVLLGDELKMPMMANSRAEVDSLINGFMYQLPNIQVFLRWASGEQVNYGNTKLPAPIAALKEWPVTPSMVKGADKWYVMTIRYNTARLGDIAIYNPGKAWEAYASQIRWRMAATTLLTALLMGLLVYIMSGRVRNYLRELAQACRRVGGGDFSAHLPVRATNEFGKVFYQFNQMVSNLEQREKIHDLYGHYQRPQLVADEYDRNAHRADKQREVSILAIQVMNFHGSTLHSPQDDALHILNRYFALFEFIAHEFGGHVDHISGDEMVVVFNHPFDLKCHENQAAKAGMAIAAAATRLTDGAADAVGFRIGLAIGEVMIGYLGTGRRRQLTVAGAPVELASQLARGVESDGVIAPYGTMLVLGHGFRPKELGECPLSAGKQVRCINILPGEAYVEQEIAAVVEKAFQSFNPVDDPEDDPW
ncbi:Putative Adenylate/Guanylate Cyclase [Mariprofundus ferrooxydans PV-1]|uniref:Putative Adenylate/Guanylate Cyclase n=2 Tax=Mariprofundus ferrooxydans TaxID=314344 RepID=Q0EX80_9PROT|nr:Putative Adenylate/Guanylate Cyclase [Mariprofundus ferrooxydans PV-1]